MSSQHYSRSASSGMDVTDHAPARSDDTVTGSFAAPPEDADTVSAVDTLESPPEPAPPGAERRSRRRARHRRRAWVPGPPAPVSSGVTERARLLVWSLLGIACLLAAHWLQPDYRALFVLPSDPVGWAALVCGVTGMWLVPGLWLSALVARTGAGQPAWLGTRVATTLLWYAVAGPIINRAGQDARVTSGGLIILTVAATAAVLLGVVFGLSRRPARLWLRALVAAFAGAVLAQAAISVTMRVWTVGMNYEHIRRLDWLIVMCCAALVALGTMSRPRMPMVRASRHLVRVLIAVAVVAATAASISLASSIWSPAQQMQSVLSAEQIPAPPGIDLAFALNSFGPDGAELYDFAEFTVFDDTGRPVPVSTSIQRSETEPASATLLVRLEPDARPMLCTSIQAAKLTVRDEASRMQVQGFVPDGWCSA